MRRPGGGETRYCRSGGVGTLSRPARCCGSVSVVVLALVSDCGNRHRLPVEDLEQRHIAGVAEGDDEPASSQVKTAPRAISRSITKSNSRSRSSSASAVRTTL